MLLYVYDHAESDLKNKHLALIMLESRWIFIPFSLFGRRTNNYFHALTKQQTQIGTVQIFTKQQTQIRTVQINRQCLWVGIAVKKSGGTRTQIKMEKCFGWDWYLTSWWVATWTAWIRLVFTTTANIKQVWVIKTSAPLKKLNQKQMVHYIWFVVCARCPNNGTLLHWGMRYMGC